MEGFLNIICECGTRMELVCTIDVPGDYHDTYKCLNCGKRVKIKDPEEVLK